LASWINHQISQLADLIWEEQGRPHERDAEHWQEAERRTSVATASKSPKAVGLAVRPSGTKKTAKSVDAAKPKEKKKA
jgi:hypothetical protein